MPQRRKIRSTGDSPAEPHATPLNLHGQTRRVFGYGLSSDAMIVGCFALLSIWTFYLGPFYSSSMTPYGQETPNLEQAISTMSTATLNDFFVDNDARNSSSAISPTAANPNYLIFHHYVHSTQSSAIEDMLMCHAYAFHKSATYGGACSGADTPEIAANKALLNVIGLKEALPFKCSVDYPRSPQTRVSTIPRSSYRKDDTRIWTPEYLDYLRSLVRYPKKKSDQYTIAVHIRRGKVSPCQELQNGYSKYLPNSHYMSLIDKYNEPGARVIIFSQLGTFESLDVFSDRGYEIYLGADVGNIWRHFLTADVLILSRSDFSMVPAYLAKGKVVYTPMWHMRGRGWTRVPDDIMQQSDKEMKRLQNLC